MTTKLAPLTMSNISSRKGTYRFAGSTFDLHVITDGENNLWFKGNEVAKILNYAKPTDAIAYNVKSHQKRTWLVLSQRANITHFNGTDTSSWHPATVFINEMALYKLLARSNRAESFQEWLVDDGFLAVELQSQIMQMLLAHPDANKRIALIKSDADKQVALIKSDADKQLALIKSDADRRVTDADKQIALIKSDADRRVADVDNQIALVKSDADRRVTDVDNQIALIKSDADKQLALIKSDADKRVALAKSDADRRVADADKQVALIKSEITIAKLESDKKCAEMQLAKEQEVAKLNLKMCRMEEMARANVAQFAVHVMMTEDAEEKNDILREMLKRNAPNVAAEMTAECQQYISVYAYALGCYKVCRCQLRNLDASDRAIARYQREPPNDAERTKLKRSDRWLLSARRIFKERCANSVSFWNKLKIENPDFMYGVQFLGRSPTDFIFEDEIGIRAKYRTDQRNARLIEASGIPRDDIEFNRLDFRDETDAVTRCLTPPNIARKRIVELFHRLLEVIRAESDGERARKRSRNEYGFAEIQSFFNRSATPALLSLTGVQDMRGGPSGS